ncbi:MAG: bifunctional diaminohydroxyphosphoribosylaminopyrimidine deaminase/5-amino-6-(5-phosphoribosylamino)uracil reductase RibD [Candidatus Poseidoniaceae archaeon]
MAAERGRGRVSPNPLVGCVLVKEGQVIAEGWHDHLGGLHAEQMAIHDAETNGFSPNGATAYVTLEPCNHFGRTPPCTEALMWAGIKEVIVAHPDPNPTVRGAGIEVLEKAGIHVRQGLLEDEAGAQMRPFMHWCEHRRPMVTVKVAVDRNGSVDDRSQHAGRFTSEGCLDEVHRLRNECDAVLVGAETVVRDNPSLTVRRLEANRQPLRIVIDPNDRIPKDSILLNDGEETLHVTDTFRGLTPLLNQLGDREVQRLLVEGGPTTIHAFLEAGLVDEFFLVLSTVEHAEPVDAGINAELLSNAGLLRFDDKKWGDEIVQHWSR